MQDAKIAGPGQDAITYARELLNRSYDHVYVWHYVTQINGYPATDRRAAYAHGYAVNYAGQLRFEDGTRAPHCEGVVIICGNDSDGTGIPLGKLVKSERALITIGGEFGAYYLASYNPRDTTLRNDQRVNPGIFPQANFREITARTWSGGPDAPATFYDFRLSPAGDVPEDLIYNA